MVRNMLPLKMNNPKLTLCVLLLTACACILPGAAFVIKPKCSELQGTVELMNDPDICDLKPGVFSVGNGDVLATLDFSKADETTINTFLAKFTEINGAIIMDGNDQVATMNFGTIKEMDNKKVSPGDNYIVIRNNAKLKTIDWHPSLKVADRDVVMLIYNNPPLSATSLGPLRTALTDNNKIKTHFQSTGLGECQFEHPLTPADSSKYIPPTAEFLKACKKIKGDLILENINLSGIGPIELDSNACLRLVNVNMKNAKLTTQAMAGKETCKDGTQSKLSNNADLCGIDLEGLHNYFKDRALVVSEPDVATCTVQCPPAQASVYIHCATPPPTASPPPHNSTPTDADTITPSGGDASELHQRTTTPKPQKPSISIPLLVAVLFGCVLILAVMAYLFYKCFWKKKKEKKGKKTTKKSGNSSPKPSSKSRRRNTNNGSGSTSSTDAQPGGEEFPEFLAPDLSNLHLFDYEGLTEGLNIKKFRMDKNGPVARGIKNMANGLLRECNVISIKEEYAKEDYAGSKGKRLKKRVFVFTPDGKDKQVRSVGVATPADVARAKDLESRGKMRHTGLTVTATEKVSDDLDANRLNVDGVDLILAQGPNENTKVDFLKMLIDEGIRIILMLCGYEEGEGDDRQIKCEHYLPAEGEVLVVGNKRVTLTGTTGPKDVLLKGEYKVTEDKKPDRFFDQYHFLKWADHEALHPKYLLLLVDLLEHLKGMGRTLIHCSAGIGRTGTAALLSLVLERMKKGEDGADLLVDTFRKVRKRRGNAIQNAQQYLCVILALLLLGLRCDIFDNKEDIIKLVNLILEDLRRNSGGKKNGVNSAEMPNSDKSNNSKGSHSKSRHSKSHHSKSQHSQSKKSESKKKEPKQKQNTDQAKLNQAKPSPTASNKIDTQKKSKGAEFGHANVVTSKIAKK